jgi:ABC-2 type transport system permease protein
MRIILSITLRILKQLLHQPRTIALLMGAPIVAFSLFWLIFNNQDSSPVKIGVYGGDAAIFTVCDKMSSQLICSEIKHVESIETKLLNGNLDGAIEIASSAGERKATVHVGGIMFNKIKRIKLIGVQILLQSNIVNIIDNVKRNQASMQQQISSSVFAKMFTKNMPQPSNINTIKEENILTKYTYKIGNFSLFEDIGPVMMVIQLFFFVFLTSSVMFLNERTSGTLYRILLSPLRPYQLLIGYIIAFGILVSIQALLLQFFYGFVLGMRSNGSVLDATAVYLSLSFCAMSIGILVSVIVKSEFEAVQFMPIIALPQVAFSGLFDLSHSPILEKISYIFPVRHACDALVAVMLKGQKISNVLPSFLAIWGFSVLFFILALLVIAKYKPKYK